MSEQTDYDRATNEQLSRAAAWLAGVASRHPDASQAVKTDAVIHGTAIALRLENDAATIATQAAQIEALAEVLTEVMEWIKNWDPQFVQDDEWGETKGKVERALSNTGKK